MSLSEKQMRELVERINARSVNLNDAMSMLRFVAEGEPVLVAEGDAVIEDEALLLDVKNLVQSTDVEAERLLYAVANWIRENRPNLFSVMAHKVAAGAREPSPDSILAKAFLVDGPDSTKTPSGN